MSPRGRPLDRVYPVVLIDALMVMVRDGVVANRPVYSAMCTDCDGGDPPRTGCCSLPAVATEQLRAALVLRGETDALHGGRRCAR
jgi:Transposase, Mutator family